MGGAQAHMRTMYAIIRTLSCNLQCRESLCVCMTLARERKVACRGRGVVRGRGKGVWLGKGGGAGQL